MMVAVVGTKMPWAKLRRVVHPTVFLLTLVLVAVALNLYVLRPSKRTPEPWTDVARNKPAEAIARALHVAERPWANSPPGWCKDLIANPLESGMYRNSSLCTRGRFDVICKKDGLPRFFSQYNQDIWSFQNHFRFLKRRGVYVDIAANEPVRISNTYFYDKCLQWRGLCVEANKRYFDVLKQHRSCAITPACVSDQVGNVAYYLRKGLSGVKATNKNNWDKLKESQIVNVQCVRTADALAAAGISEIDLLSLDVEGHEYNVLRGIDWERTRINVIIIETLSTETKELLHNLGYKKGVQPVLKSEKRKKGDIYRDYVYLHPDVVWGKPV